VAAPPQHNLGAKDGIWFAYARAAEHQPKVPDHWYKNVATRVTNPNPDRVSG